MSRKIMNHERRKIEYVSEQYKDGRFSEAELKQYSLSDEEIAVILDYQSLLPILQQTDEQQNVNARDLHKQLKVGRQFTDWMKNRIEIYDLIEGVDYIQASRKYEAYKYAGIKETTDYMLSLDCAKQLAMIERSEIGKLTRRYFILIEKAFKNRNTWNISRKATLINCKELRGALITRRIPLIEGLPDWMTNCYNLYAIEFALLNNVILGMSATEFKKLHNLSDSKLTRNFFSEDQLDDVERLERYDAQLILAQEIYDYERRKEMLIAEYSLFKNRRTKYI